MIKSTTSYGRYHRKLQLSITGQDSQNLKIKININKCSPFCACQIYMKQLKQNRILEEKMGGKKKETYESESKIAQLI